MVKLTIWFKTKSNKTEAVHYFFKLEKRAKIFALGVAEQWEAKWQIEKKEEESQLKRAQ